MQVKNRIDAFNEAQSGSEKRICILLRNMIDENLPEADSKIWHAHPVWFLESNPIVGYNKLKDCIRLMFWSGQSFETPGLSPTGSFMAAEVRYTALAKVDRELLSHCMQEAKLIQWDYMNISKRKGKLERLL